MSNQENHTAFQRASHCLPELAPPDYVDPLIEVYKKDVDRTLLRENLKLTVEQRIKNALKFHQSIEKWREAGKSTNSADGRRNDLKQSLNSKPPCGCCRSLVDP
jgi:hypothetical protein